jgi:hypothetical protein
MVANGVAIDSVLGRASDDGPALCGSSFTAPAIAAVAAILASAAVLVGLLKDDVRAATGGA